MQKVSVRACIFLEKVKIIKWAKNGARA